jgi:glutamate dehydrogenase (NAD(P)+)
VGYHTAKFLSEEDGCKVIAIADRSGMVFDEDGLTVEDVYSYKVEHKTLKGFPGAQFNEDGKQVLAVDCDILIPAALEGVINLGNVEEVKARLIVEAANGPVTYAADEKLRARGVIIIPDAYANAGGVVVSYFEWIRNLSHIRFGRMQRRYDGIRGEQLIQSLEEMTGKKMSSKVREKLMDGASELDLVRSGLDDSMRQAFQELCETRAENLNITDYRTAAYVNAIRKISRSYLDIGIY